MGVRYRGDLADLFVCRIGERQGCDAHERSVAVVALTGASFAGVQGAGGRAAVIENAVDRILATGNPAYELVAHVRGVDVPKLPNRVAGSKCHRCVVAPGAGGLSMRAVEEEHACVIGVPVKDTIKVGNAKHYAVDTPDRSCLWAVQTPQSFSYELLMEAYGEMWQAAESGERITDDAMIVERFTGHKVKLVQGKYENIKVTTPEDLLIAEVFLKKAKKMKNCKC